MSVPRIYVLVGSGWNYPEECSEWLVAAYTSREQAESHMKLAKEAKEKKSRESTYDASENIRQCKHVEYFLHEVALCRHVDEYLESQ